MEIDKTIVNISNNLLFDWNDKTIVRRPGNTFVRLVIYSFSEKLKLPLAIYDIFWYWLLTEVRCILTDDCDVNKNLTMAGQNTEAKSCER